MQEYIPNSDIFTIDAQYHLPELASIHLVRSKNRIAIIDTGTTYSAPQVKQALESLQINFDHVDFIILTHIHLDHAGGASQLMALCKNAKLVVHPKGARHMIDPKKLIEGTIAVYGEERFTQLYGRILPIDADRIIEPSDGETINLAGRPLLFIDTPGHANHHHCIIDSQTNSAFTGDTLGVAYRQLRSEGNAFMAPTTTPVQFNPDALHASIDKVMSFKPKYLYLTHYSVVAPSTQNIASLHEQIDDFVMLTQQCAEQANFEEELTEQITSYLVQRCINELPQISQQVAQDWLKLDANLNAQGLAYWWQYRRNSSESINNS